MKRKIFFYLVIAAFSPLSTAFGATETATQPSEKIRDMTIQDLKAMHISVVMKDATPENDNHATTVMLTGAISEDCLRHFEITNSQTDPELKVKGIAFRMRDIDGEGLDCKKKERTCRGAGCLHLSTDVPAAKMDLSNEGDSEIKLVTIKDGDPNQPGHIDAVPLSLLSEDLPAHRSKKTIARLAKEKAAKEQEEHVSLLQDTITTCRKTPAELPIARRAARSLFNLDNDSSSFKKVLQELDMIELQLMVAKAKKIPLSELEGLRQELLNWRMTHADSAEYVADALRMLAARLVNQKDKAEKKTVTLDDFRVARELLLEAQDDETLSAKTISSLQKDIDANDTGYLAAFGMSAANTQDPFALDAFNGEFRGTVERLTERLRDACYGENRSMEGCSIATNAYRNVMAIPATVQKIQQERWQNEQRINQQLAQMPGQGQPQGPQNMPGMSQMPQMPMTQGGAWVPYQQTQMSSMPGMPMNSGMQMNNGGFWSGGNYGRANTF
ncbi:MAG TPA: hypothetical protein DCS07_18405 [Bdellovibrionales bacterium]|nr:MAG: hypothetical protein A2Z97_05720 [Bdellovibrionales bacterium GWB1_52_6]OFZ04372.1 MAG: hypothetical protein A2X97_06935 [Bdellovibrionales bacterium GWA1_52_35]OFZ36626.1 MAG: hypothetical protein A2070_12505 [Bdellovibrionales bacterium GWC1_52_8]HAR44575.1 hypothetical protein [Bdellovibrionales bacterium]HCM40772.1 hypothetical protein [Bdellovibrionales bacterium]